METKEELGEAIAKYKEIIFGSDTSACMTCLYELLKQQIIDQKLYDQKLMEDTMRKLEWERLLCLPFFLVQVIVLSVLS